MNGKSPYLKRQCPDNKFHVSNYLLIPEFRIKFQFPAIFLFSVTVSRNCRSREMFIGACLQNYGAVFNLLIKQVLTLSDNI